MTYYLRVLWACLTANLPPRCTACRRRIFGPVYSSSLHAPAGREAYRHYPDCP